MANKKKASPDKASTSTGKKPGVGAHPGTTASAEATHASVDVTRETLEATPARVVVFLRALGTSVPLRSILAQRGYTPDEHQRGWRLLHAVSGYESEIASTPAPVEDRRAAQAVATLDAWDESGLRIVSAALRHRHPAQHAFVLDGLHASTGAAAVVGVKVLLDRLDALQTGKGRAASVRADDQRALATLAARGVDARERARLRVLVQQAEGYGAVTDVAAQEQSDEAAERQHLTDLRALRAWYEEWSEIAHAVIKRRDHLLRLGLARTKTRQSTRATTPPGEK